MLASAALGTVSVSQFAPLSHMVSPPPAPPSHTKSAAEAKSTGVNPAIAAVANRVHLRAFFARVFCIAFSRTPASQDFLLTARSTYLTLPTATASPTTCHFNLRPAGSTRERDWDKISHEAGHLSYTGLRICSALVIRY